VQTGAIGGTQAYRGPVYRGSQALWGVTGGVKQGGFGAYRGDESIGVWSIGGPKAYGGVPGPTGDPNPYRGGTGGANQGGLGAYKGAESIGVWSIGGPRPYRRPQPLQRGNKVGESWFI